ncbi:MAG: polyprenyl synthetase family protein [Deltaproteobacteria bacterium]|nr:polyprenyl synthetase family protein [Deltaproteobacteria bacterium]
MTADLSSYLEEKRRVVHEAMARRMDVLPKESRLAQAMRYCLDAGGKRVRPILCIAAAEAVGGSQQDCLDAACALEFIHTYSLIHDDLPAMDDDDLRRGKPTCHKAFDEATAILAGDALLTYAFQVLCRPGPPSCESRMRVAEIIAEKAGWPGMVEGQMLDIQAEGKHISLNELENLHRKKTGALIEAAVLAGAVLAGADAARESALLEYAQKIGLLFQVTDDILNVSGSPEELGKAVGTDELREKSTYPSLLGLDGAREFARELTREALRALEGFDNRSDPLRALARYLENRRK